MDSDTKLIVSYVLGNRDGVTARILIEDLKERLTNRGQLTTDGHRAYLQSVEESFGADIDYAMVSKIYASPAKRKPGIARRSASDAKSRRSPAAPTLGIFPRGT